MRRINKTFLGRRTSDILKDNEGTSIVLVTIIAILIITSVVILRMTVNSLLASADKQYNQDRAYMMATSMGETLDSMITSNNYPNLESFSYSDSITPPYPVSARTESRELSDGTTVYELIVTATVGDSTYQYTAVYSGSGPYKRMN